MRCYILETVNARKSADTSKTKQDDGPLQHEQKQNTTKKRAYDVVSDQSRGTKRLKKQGTNEGKKKGDSF